MRKFREILRSVGEQISAPFGWQLSFSGIRSAFRLVGGTFWPKSHPISEGTIVNYDLCRQLYRNSGDKALGSGFAKPIVDLQVGFIGIPVVTVGDDGLDEFLNDCITTYWAERIQEMIRDSIRDSKVIVRMRRPDILDPLMTLEEAQHMSLECIPPERVDIQYNMRNRNIIEQAIVITRMNIVTNPGNLAMGQEPLTEEHDILEIMNRDEFTYYDQTDSRWLTDMQAPNPWGFVPILEVFNEWDSYLQGGQSDLETVIPFITAFNDVMNQGLNAHAYHSTPKIKMKLLDVGTFIKNNFPEAWDDQTGTVKHGAAVDWKGREIIFFQSEEDATFLEARSVLGDTKELLEFLIDCICIASQTPEWAFMRVDSGSANSDRNAQTVPLMEKIDRKRRNYAVPIQQLCKMALVAFGEIPYRPKVTWEIVREDDKLVLAQAFQQVIMGLEVAAQRGEISDETYRSTIKMFLPLMQGVKTEGQEAITPPPLPAVPTNGNVPATTSVPIKAGPQGKNE